MRASLVSATSLIALLLLEGEPAHAAPSLIIANQSVVFGDVLVGGTPNGTAAAISDTIQIKNGHQGGGGGYNSTFSATAATNPFTTSISGASITNNAATTVAEGFTFLPTITGLATSVVVARDSVSAGSVSPLYSITLTGTGVAPIGALSSSSTNYFLVNGSGTGQTATVAVTNSGNGNLSGTTTNAGGIISNLRGSIGGGTASSLSGFQGVASSISLGDGATNSYSYSFAPTVKAQTASTLVVATLANGSSNGQNAGFNQTLTFSGTGVAPVQSVSNSPVTYARVGTVSTTSVTVQNVGNGNRATGSVSNPASNLNGSIAGVTTIAGLTGPGAGSTLSLADGGTSVFTYTYSPTSRTAGSLSSLVSLAFGDGNSNGSNTAQSITSTLFAQAVGPVFASTKYGTSGNGTTIGGTTTTITTPTASPKGSVGASGASISFGTVGYKQSETLYLLLQNTTTDPGTAAQTNLTIDKYSIAGKSAYEFSSSFTPGSTITEGGQILLPITITSSGGGALSSTLTVFTDQSAALGGTGDTFTYTLTAFAVPEPATIAVLGAGLAGLAGMRRRRKQAETR